MKATKVKNPPYTIVGCPTIPQSIGFTFKVGGLRELIKGLGDNDLLTVESFSGYKASEFTIHKQDK